MYAEICRPQKRTLTEDYSLFFIETGDYAMIEQGFGVCDQVADAINNGYCDPTSEVGEVATAISKAKGESDNENH